MKIVESLDDFIIDMPFGVQALVNIFDRYGGVKYHNLALGTIIVGDAYMMSVIFSHLFTADTMTIELFMLSLAYGVFALLFTYYLLELLKMVKAQTMHGRQNPARDDFFEINRRTLFLFLSIALGLIDVYDGTSNYKNIYYFVVTLSFYIAACSEAPPTRDTVPQT